MQKKHLKRILFLILLSIPGILILIGLQTEIGQALLAKYDLQYFRNVIESLGPWGPAVFMIVYYFILLIFISSAAVSVLAGLLFGNFWGSVYVVTAATLSAQTAFYIGRKLGQEKVKNLKSDSGFGKMIKKLDERVEKNGFTAILVLRFLLLPFIILSYSAGTIPKLKARDFFFGTLLANAIISPAFVYLGDSLLKGPKALILPVLAVTLVLLIPKIVKRIKS